MLFNQSFFVLRADFTTKLKIVIKIMKSTVWHETLSCPWCGDKTEKVFGSTSSNVSDYGILRCACREYPVVAGIPVILIDRIADTHIRTKQVCKAIREARETEALLSLMCPREVVVNSNLSRWHQLLPPIFINKQINRRSTAARLLWQKRAKQLLVEHRDATAQQIFNLYFGPLGKSAQDPLDYFMYRFGQPRHLSALSLATMVDVSAGPILDVGCGAGHITRFFCNQSPDTNIIGIDTSFFMLYVAKNWVAPTASYVCCDAEMNLPFEADSFAGINCVNTFHFIHNKLGCVRELCRVTHDDGLFLISALRHADYPTKTPNVALPARGYANLWGGFKHAILSDRCILKSYFDKKTPDCDLQIDLNKLAEEPMISMIISRDKRYFEDQQTFAQWPHAAGRLDINPLYKETESTKSHVKLKRSIPSNFYANENRELLLYLPESVKISIDTIEKLESTDTSAEMVELIEHCVLLDIPPKYCEPVICSDSRT